MRLSVDSMPEQHVALELAFGARQLGGLEAVAFHFAQFRDGDFENFVHPFGIGAGVDAEVARSR